MRWLIHRITSKSLFFTIYYVLSVPIAIMSILGSHAVHASYRMTWRKKLALGLRMFWSTARIPSGSTYKAHLAMALKLLELPPPPELPGVVVECGTWKGASAANLSLICRIVGRRLLVCDSFEGLPQPIPETPDSSAYGKGDYCGALDEVKKNIERYGAIEVCEFVKGWFQETLPRLDVPIVLAWVDVDLEDSLETCVLNLWPRLVPDGYLFLDECVGISYVALFFSEHWWDKHFNRVPPGMIGAGTGLPLGDYYIGPFDDLASHPLQHASTAGYTRPCFVGHWCGPANRRQNSMRTSHHTATD